jgi:queuosine precursor transporter
VIPNPAAELAQPPPQRAYRHYDFLVGGFVAVLLCSNLVGASKITMVGGVTFGAGILLFPLSYVFGDVLTEVYGYARSRRVVWTGFAAMSLASVMTAIIIVMPPAPGWSGQAALEQALGQTPRIALASMIAYLVGELTNSYVLAKMKLRTRGRFLWLRTIGSTVCGEAVDSAIFYPLAFWGVWTNELVMIVMITNYLLKVGWEVVLTPVTYWAVSALKRAENEDHYDWNTKFTPFRIKSS